MAYAYPYNQLDAYNQFNTVRQPGATQVQPPVTTFRHDAYPRQVYAYPRNVDGELGHD